MECTFGSGALISRFLPASGAARQGGRPTPRGGQRLLKAIHADGLAQTPLHLRRVIDEVVQPAVQRLELLGRQYPPLFKWHGKAGSYMHRAGSAREISSARRVAARAVTSQGLCPALPLISRQSPCLVSPSVFLARSARLVRYVVQQRGQVLVGSRITD